MPSSERGAGRHRAPTPLSVVIDSVTLVTDLLGWKSGFRQRETHSRSTSLQGDSLDTPVGELTDQQVVLVAAIDGVDQAEFLHELAGGAELAHHRAVELHLVDGGVVHAVGVAGVSDVEVLGRSRGHAHGLGGADAAELALEGPLPIEHLDPLVADIGHVDVALGIEGDALRAVELAVTGARRAPMLDEPAVWS